MILNFTAATNCDCQKIISQYLECLEYITLMDQVGSGEKRIHCSGSIIDPTHIITAAHCFFPK